MSGAPEASGPSRPRTDTALRASALLALVTTLMTGCGGGGNAPEGTPTTRSPAAAGAATLFPGDETGQADAPQIDFPRADPGESAAVDVTVVNSTDEPMKVEAVQFAGNGEPPGTAAPTISENSCQGRPVPPHKSCRFRMLIPTGAADTDFKLEIRTDQGNVTAAVSARESGKDTTTPDQDTGTGEPGTPTKSLPPDGGRTTEPTPDPDTVPAPDPDTAPEPDPDTPPEPAPDTVPEEGPPVTPT